MNKDLHSVLNEGVVCRIYMGDDVVFESSKSGIASLVEAIDNIPNLKGCVAFDKIVGKAAALLYVYMGATAVYAGVMSSGGMNVLKSHGIKCYSDVLTDKIINRAGDDICPMEKAVSEIDKPKEALNAIRQKIASLREQNIKKTE